MKRLICLLISFGLLLGFMSSAYSGQWRAGTTAQTIPGTTSISDIDTVSYQNMTAPLDRLHSNAREGCIIVYASTSTITVGAGEVVLQNSAGTITLMQQNTSATTVSWSDIDTGAEAASTTYYLWAYQATATDTDFDVAMSTSSSAPSGKTYYARLGSFYNDSSSNIVNDSTIVNDNRSAIKQFGSWVSKSYSVSYLASSDGFVVGYTDDDGGGDSEVSGFTDGSNPPTTIRYKAEFRGVDDGNAAICMPVKKSDYWKVTFELGSGNSLYWIPNE